MRKLLPLCRDERGAAVIEMAIALPVLVTFIWGLLQIGLAFQASAGMQHGLGEGARFATLCFNPDPDTGCETPTDAQIRTKVGEKVFGTGNGTLDPLEIVDTTTTTGTTTTVVYKTLTLNYSQPTNFLFFPGPTISLSRSKRVYLAG